MRGHPFSLIFFLITGVVMLLQMIPIVGILLMFMLAMFWSVLLINAGMIGIGVEALIGRVSRRWLMVPLAFYGGYYVWALSDRATFSVLSASYVASNAKVAVPFDANAQSLVFTGGGDGGGWFTQNYDLPVAYTSNDNYPEGYRSTRMMPNAVCSKVRENKALSAAQVHSFGFHDGDAIQDRKMEARFCDLGMPERPSLPIVTVSTVEEKISEGLLPVTRVARTVTTPDGRRFTLLGGIAAPLKWFPMPAMGCGLNSGAASWNCDAGFLRDSFTPIVPGATRYSRDMLVLAEALGLKRMAIADRKGGDATLVLAKLAQVEADTLTRQLAALDQMIADPLAKNPQWDLGVVRNRPEALLSRADAIMAGLENAASVSGSERWKARESGRILAGLVAGLPRERFVRYGPRTLALYRANFEPVAREGDRKAESHWLWETESLLRRLGNLGPEALFVATDRRASVPNVNGAGVEAMCRVGAAGRAVAGPVLLDMWRGLEANDRDGRAALFVAMRRVGVAVPPIVESEKDRARRERGNGAFGGVFAKQLSPMDELTRDWGDVTPTALPRVCATYAEQQARREEQYGGKRKTNLE
jgi:hypothetical protein